jgi:hypothetical protein
MTLRVSSSVVLLSPRGQSSLLTGLQWPAFVFGVTVLGVISIIPAHGLNRVIFAIETILVFVAGILGVNKMWQRSPR